MISVFDFSGVEHPISDYTQFHITHREDGCDVMSFCLDTTHEQYGLLQEEAIVRTDQNEYLIKKIDDDRIDCQLNFDFLKRRTYLNYRSETRSLYNVLTNHIPQDWTIEGATVSSIRRTIEFDTCTDYDVVYQCMKVYGVKFIWHMLEKRLVVVDPSKIEPSGEYVTTELNLQALSFKGESTSFATRLYAYGFEGMTMENAVVGGQTYGLTYVENTAYCDKLVCATWKDERYTIPENLYEAAMQKLAAMSMPTRSYSCKVMDLAKQDEQYAFLTFVMHRKLTLIDTDRGIRVEHQICEYDEWPDEEGQNTVTLNCVQDNIYNLIDDAVEVAKEDTRDVEKKIAEGDSAVSKALEDRLNIATAMLTSAFGSYFRNVNGELYMMDDPEPARAQVVWRWNVNGFAKSSTGIEGPYTTSLTFDDTFVTGVIEALVIRGDLIEANTISAEKIQQSYTDGVLSQSFTTAKGYVDALFSDLNTYLTNDDGTGQLDVLVADIAEIQQSIAGMVIGFQEAFRGGINYVQNSAGLNGVTNDWTTEGTVVTMQNSDTKNYTTSNSCFRLSAGAKLSQLIDSMVIGEAYTISCKVKKTGTLLSDVHVVYNGETIGTLFNSSSVSAMWTECQFTIPEISSGTLEIVASTRSDHLFISDIMVCEGISAKAWTPAPDEIYTSGVKIDKRGITVYRSGTNERTVISNEEFAGYNGEDEIFSLNGDETRIVNAIVRKMLRIEDTMMIPFESGGEKGLNIALID